MKSQLLFNRKQLLITTTLLLIVSCCFHVKAQNLVSKMYPAAGASDINPDTHLILTFSSEPEPGTSGKIKIYNAQTHELVDMLDMSIPAGPTEPNRVKVPYIEKPYVYESTDYTNKNTKPGTPSGGADPAPDSYQLNIIGRFTDGFHFYPVIIHGNTATICPHNNMLEYGKKYYVLIDPEVFTIKGAHFKGITKKTDWVFTTKKTPPSKTTKKLIVAADGSGDFNTVQGAMDFIPDYQQKRVQVFVKNGTYEEIVYFRNKDNVSIKGESREGVIVCYNNNEVFNPHPVNIATNEWPGTFPSRRAALMVDHCTGIILENLTIKSINKKPAQAEGLLINGEQNAVINVDIYGSGDALQVNGSTYFFKTRITGMGDNILGRGPSFFKDCELVTMGGPHVWIRNTEKNHGDIFVGCTFRTLDGKDAVIARSPDNHGKGYPYAEAVLINCKLQGVRPVGFDPVEGDTTNVHFWEYNSTDLETGKPIDMSQRHPATKELKMPDDKEVITNYGNAEYILGDWVKALLIYY